jgi:Zn-dependent protease
MRLRTVWRIGRIAGIEIAIHPSWLIIYVLFAWSATVAVRYFDGDLNEVNSIILGLIASLVLFASVVAHEFAHALVARRLGIPIEGITLFLFGGVASILREPPSPGAELAMAAAGPALSLVLAALFLLLSVGAHALNWTWGWTFCVFLAAANGMLAVFNLLPAFPSDGGRILRALLWMRKRSQARATGTASAVSLVVAVCLAGAGLYFVLGEHEYRGVWWMVIGSFLAQAAMTSARQARVDLVLEQLRVRECMLSKLIPVPADTTVGEFIGEIAGVSGAAYPVVRAGELVGIADVRQTAGIPLQRWPSTPLSAIMAPIGGPGLREESSARDALAALHSSGRGELPVFEAGVLVGVITQEAIFRALHGRKGSVLAANQP